MYEIFVICMKTILLTFLFHLNRNRKFEVRRSDGEASGFYANFNQDN